MARLFALVVLFAGCATDGSAPTERGSSPQCEEAAQHSDLAWLQANVFTPGCAAFGGCHGSSRTMGNLNLESGTSHRSLVGVTARAQPSWTRVVAGEPDASYLLVAIGHLEGPAPSRGLMPLSAQPLCVEKREAIERWIFDGAKP